MRMDCDAPARHAGAADRPDVRGIAGWRAFWRDMWLAGDDALLIGGCSGIAGVSAVWSAGSGAFLWTDDGIFARVSRGGSVDGMVGGTR